MPRNGSGSYSPPSNTWNPATPETPILSDDWNVTLADLATAMTGSLASDGQTTTTAVIRFTEGIAVSDGLLTAPSIAPIGDADTGLYFPAANQASLVCGGTAVLAATSTGVTFPLGVTFAGSQTVTGNLTVDGNTTLGSASGDTLTVNATSTFAAPVTFNGLATATAGITANAFNGPIGAGTPATGAFTNVTASGTLGVTGTATVGVLAVTGAATVTGASVLNGAVSLGDAAADAITVKGLGRAMYITTGTANATGQVSFGTGLPGTLAEGEIYMQHAP